MQFKRLVLVIAGICFSFMTITFASDADAWVENFFDGCEAKDTHRSTVKQSFFLFTKPDMREKLLRVAAEFGSNSSSLRYDMALIWNGCAWGFGKGVRIFDGILMKATEGMLIDKKVLLKQVKKKMNLRMRFGIAI